jgi:hypothetical protein
VPEEAALEALALGVESPRLVDVTLSVVGLDVQEEVCPAVPEERGHHQPQHLSDHSLAPAAANGDRGHQNKGARQQKCPTPAQFHKVLVQNVIGSEKTEIISN